MRWFDLTRFGAMMTVLPRSSVRLNSILRIELRRHSDYIKETYNYTQNLKDGAEGFDALENLDLQLRTLGFGPFELRQLPSATQKDFDYYGSEYTAYVAEAVRQSINLRQLQRVFPGLSQSDIVDVPETEVMVMGKDFHGHEALWERLREILGKDTSSVWVPINDPWAPDVRTPTPILKALSQEGLSIDRDQRINTFPDELAQKADQLSYRSDALVTYYVSEAAAQMDGLSAGQYVKTAGLPGAVPLLAEGIGKIVALRDVWAMPDLRRSISPAIAYRMTPGSNPNSFLHAYLLKRNAYRDELRSVLRNFENWLEAHEQHTKQSPELVRSTLAVFKNGLDLIKDYRHLIGEVGTFPDEQMKGAFQSDPMGQFVPREINDINDTALEALALSAQLLSMAPSDMTLATLQGVKRQWAKIAAAQLDEAHAHQRTSDNQASNKAIKHVDVGEKIGGARKDYARRYLGITDLEEMNSAELSINVAKSNIWPPLKYAQMKENDVDPIAAMGIKIIRNSLLNKPPTRHSYSDAENYEITKKYVQTVQAIRDVLAEVKTLDQLQQAADSIKNYDLSIRPENIQSSIGYRTLPLISNICKVARHKTIKEIGVFNHEKQDYEFPDPWGALIKSRPKKYEVKNSEQNIKEKIDQELRIPHLDKIERYGQNWRDGRNVTAEDLLKEFGFRAIEYGEWLPQSERQEVINMAYDSCADLAQALKLSPMDVSLGGRLALAFGARGKGGKKPAAAHYEIERNVLNLTRIRGAGCLAHEWFHAFDCKMAKDAGIPFAFASELNSTTELFSQDINIFKSLKGIITNIYHRPPTPEEAMDFAEQKATQCRNIAQSLILNKPVNNLQETHPDLRRYFTRMSASIENYLSEQSTHIERLSNQEVPYHGFTGMLSYEKLQEIKLECQADFNYKTDYKYIAKELNKQIDTYLENISIVKSIKFYQKHNLPFPKEMLSIHALQEQSKYAHDAERIDAIFYSSKKSSPYWSKLSELFARAGETFVQDSIKNMGVRNDYLVSGCDETRSSSLKGLGLNVSIYPMGEERRSLNESFLKLMEEYKASITPEPTIEKQEDFTP